MNLRVRERPPLRHHLIVTAPNGRRYRWGGDERRPENAPAGLRFSSVMPGGFESLDCSLARKPGVDYADLAEFSKVEVLGAGGAVRGEYRLERSPRVSGDDMAISPSAVGPQAYLDDRKDVRIVYVDVDLTKWIGASTQRRLNMLSVGVDDGATAPDSSSGAPSLKLALSGAWAAANHTSEMWYDAGAGNPIGSIYYAWKQGISGAGAGLPGAWTWTVRIADDDVFTGGTYESAGNLAGTGPGSGTLTPTATTKVRRFASIDLWNGSAGGSEGVDFPVFWTVLAVYGDHGLTKRGTADANNAQGFYASDVLSHAIPTYAPAIGSLMIDQTDFVIPHLAFLDPTTASEVVRQATRFGLEDWAVWEGPTFHLHKRGTYGKRWRARIGPTKLEETGPQSDRIWDQIVVQYTDVSGKTAFVGPPGSGCDTEDASLIDSDSSNPAKAIPGGRRDILTMGTSTAAAAIKVGSTFLYQSRLLDTSGRATLTGYVQDDRGVLFAASAVRAGDSIVFVDAADHSERRIVRADFNDTDKSCAIDLDSPPEGLQALLERLGVVLVRLGVT